MKLRSIMIGATALVAATAAQAERASDGQLNIIYWQAPSLLNPYLSSGTKELEAASLVIEPLARYNETGAMVPFLVDEIPTVENGGVSEDLTSITWVISDGIMWSDGTPLTAEDAIFSWQYCTHPDGGCAQATNFSDVESMEAIDSQTLKITFSVPKPFPYGPFVGAQSPIIQKAQFAGCLGTDAITCSDENFAPLGTGPFVVTDFKANDVATFVANDNYRDPNKPAFATVNFKGGGDAASAARSVLETGEFDYAWNLQVEPEILTAMAAAGRGEVVSAFGTSVERLMVNFTNPDPALGDERATVAHPHPFLTDTNVTRAMSIAIDREILVIAGYGSAGQESCNVLPAPAAFASTNNEWCKNYDPDEANAILDAAGWEMQSDGVRAKDGVRLSVLFQTSTNSVRQGTQALIKQMWEAIGIETELRNIDGSVFFGGDQSSPDTFQKFFADIEMYTNNFDGTDPEAYMGNWSCAEIPSPDNAWLGNNMPRFCSVVYDALSEKMARVASLEDRAALAIAMNDMLMDAGAIIPLIHRGGVSAHANSLEGVLMNEWDSELWNAADWSRSN